RRGPADPGRVCARVLVPPDRSGHAPIRLVGPSSASGGMGARARHARRAWADPPLTPTTRSRRLVSRVETCAQGPAPEASGPTSSSLLPSSRPGAAARLPPGGRPAMQQHDDRRAGQTVGPRNGRGAGTARTDLAAPGLHRLAPLAQCWRRARGGRAGGGRRGGGALTRNRDHHMTRRTILLIVAGILAVLAGVALTVDERSAVCEV